jgi:ABC-2 type transport system ATP-binding protein
MTAVTVQNLRKRYGDSTAVDGIDLDIAAGEVFALLGPNGAGKTTTVEILEGYRRRDGGTVTVLGADPARATRRWRSRIGIVLQNASGAPELTVREIVRHQAAFHAAPRDPDQVIELVGLTEQAGKRVRRLSGGQRRRVDVALGIIGRPALLFLDEPTTGFDPQARRQFWDLIRGLADDGTTIVLTTHYLDEAEALADRVAVMARGRLVAQGDPATLGGRASGKTTVSWMENGVRRHIETDGPTRAVREIAGRFGGEVPGLTVTRPSLEETYLRLIEEER